MNDKELKYKLSLQDLFSKKMQGAVGETKRMDLAMSGLGSRIGQIARGIALASLGKNIIQTTAKFQGFDNAIVTASGSAMAGANNIKFLNDQVDKLGLDLNAAYVGYKTFSGALMGTSLEGDKANTVFRQVSEAATVMGLSGEQTEGAFLALGQMMSKGTVSAEELRGQLGERIPGAFQIAARAMGVSTAMLGEMMKKGEVVSEDFLPKFGAELERTFGKRLGASTDSLQSNLNRMNTEWERLKVTIGTEFLPEIISATKGLTKFLKENKDLIISGIKLVAVIGSGVLAFKAFSFAISGISTVMSLATTANQALNLALGVTLAELGLVIAAVGAAVLAFYALKTAFESYKELHKASESDIKAATDSEIESINKLADSYKGLSREKAISKAFQERYDALDQTRTNLMMAEPSLTSGSDIDSNHRLQTKLEGELEYLKKNKSSILSQYASGGMSSLASATGGKAGRGSSSSSAGSSTEISATRPQSIVININKMVETFELHSTNVTEGFDKIKQKLGNMLAEVANDANNAALNSQ